MSTTALSPVALEQYTRPPSPGAQKRRNIGWLALIAVAVVAAGIVCAFAWRLAGGQLYVMGTPSMCPSVCV